MTRWNALFTEEDGFQTAEAIGIAHQLHAGAGLVGHLRIAGEGLAAGVGDGEDVTALVVALVILLAPDAVLLRHQVGIVREGDRAIAHDAVITNGHAVAEGFRIGQCDSGRHARAQLQRQGGEEIKAEVAGDLAFDLGSRTAGL